MQKQVKRKTHGTKGSEAELLQEEESLAFVCD